MINSQLLEYIKQQLSLNVDKEIIKSNLIAGGGWSIQDIEEAFASSNQISKKSPKALFFVVICLIVLTGIGSAYLYLKNFSKDDTKITTQPSISNPDINTVYSSNPLQQTESTKNPPNQKVIEDNNLNVGTLTIRAVVANIDETGNKYGSYGMKFTQTKLTEVDQALKKLKAFVDRSSYGKTNLQWTTSGIYELGSGVCNHALYGDKVNDLIQRALEKADAETPLQDYSYYIVVHPRPNCPDEVVWSFEGRGQFKAYTLNGRTLHLRGMHISDLSDQYLFHEFGHSLAYKENTGIGHPDYMNCPVITENGETKIAISNTCQHIYDFNKNMTPIFSIMGTPSALSDYSAVEKEIAGWLTSSDIVTAKKGNYTLSPVEQSGPGPKALKIPIPGSDYIVYVSFREPNGYTYPATERSKPNGVIFDITNGSGISFLVTNNIEKDSPLQIGTPYRLGVNGPVVKVNEISENTASISVTSE